MTPDSANPSSLHALALVGATILGSLVVWSLIALVIHRWTRVEKQ